MITWFSAMLVDHDNVAKAVVTGRLYHISKNLRQSVRLLLLNRVLNPRGKCLGS